MDLEKNDPRLTKYNCTVKQYSPENLYKYCQNTGCELILTIKQISQESPTYMIFAHSNEERPLQLNPGVLIHNQIQAKEYEAFK